MIAAAPLPVSATTFLNHDWPKQHGSSLVIRPTRARLWAMHWGRYNTVLHVKKQPPADVGLWIFTQRVDCEQEAFPISYAETAIWASPSSENGTELDELYGVEDLSEQAQRQLIKDCYDFLQLAKAILGDRVDDLAVAQEAGMDFFLTRNGHGSGFWDGDWDWVPDDGAKRLTQLAKSFGSASLYAGDDGKLYFMS